MVNSGANRLFDDFINNNIPPDMLLNTLKLYGAACHGEGYNKKFVEMKKWKSVQNMRLATNFKKTTKEIDDLTSANKPK